MAIYCFIGPSIGLSEAEQLLPEASFLPPIAHGDLLRLKLEPGDTVAIIDGFFRQKPSVRHKEILLTLSRGIRVLGASGMGALRAAELSPFGMEGTGEVYRLYAEHQIDGDDEVALLRLPAGEGYLPLTEALVNVRHNLGRAMNSGAISVHSHATLLAIAKAMPFVDRTYQRILRCASDQMPREEAASLLQFLQVHATDLKHQDAVSLLTYLGQALIEPWRPKPFNLHRTHWLVQWEQAADGRSMRLDRGTDQLDLFASGHDLLRVCQVGCANYPSFHTEVTLQSMAALYAQALGMEPSEPNRLLAAFRTERSLQSDSAFADWLNARDLALPELLAWLERKTLASDLVQVRGPGPVRHRLERIAAAYLVHLGAIETDTDIPAPLYGWLSDQERTTLSSTQRLALAAVRLFQVQPSTPWVEPLIVSLKLSGFYQVALNRFQRMVMMSHAFEQEHPSIRLDRLALDGLTDWYTARWQSKAPFEFALLDRGFADYQAFAPVAGRYFLYDRTYPREMRTRLIPQEIRLAPSAIVAH